MDSEVERIVGRRRALVDSLKTVIIESLELDLEPDEIDEDTALFGVGLALDSIDALQLVLAVEGAYSVTIPPDDLNVYRSINTLADFLTKVDAAPR